MTAGFETYTSDGALQASSNMYGYHCRKTGTVTTVSPTYGNTETSDAIIPAFGSADALCAVQMPGHALGLIAAGGGGGWRYVTNAPVGTTVTYYIFDKLNVLNPTAHLQGIECYDSSGKIAFSTAYWPMAAIKMLTYNAAVVSDGTWGSAPYYTADPATVTVSGRNLAFMTGAAAGRQNHPTNKVDMQCWIGGVRSVGTNCDYWTYPNDGKIYGGTVNSTKNTVTTAEISWDDVTVTTPDGSAPPVWEIPLKLFVIDVTNIPLNTTFF